MISGSTRVLALIGHPVGHSLSPAMHNASFAADNLDFVYVALDVRPEDLSAAVRGAAVLGLRGFNATMPHKSALPALLDELDETAGVSGAVNTVVIEPDGTLIGHDTDGGGMVEACREIGVDLLGKRVLLLGAGGAAASIAVALGGEGISQLSIVNRNVARADGLAEKLRSTQRAEVDVYGFDALNEAARKAEVVVNVTPLGMKDGDPLPIPAEYLNEDMVVCDAVYRPGKETALVGHARERGARIVAGEKMLLYQGALAQRLWTGREPNVVAMGAALASPS